MASVNIIKRVKVGGRWKFFAIPHTEKGGPDWKALPDGRYYLEWYLAGKRRRTWAGHTVSQVLESQRRKHHELEGRELKAAGFENAGEANRKPPLHLAVAKYLEQIETIKKPNTHRKYRAVLERFLEYFQSRPNVESVSKEDLNQFVVDLIRKEHMSANTVLHNVIIIAQFFRRQGRLNITKELELPQRITSLPKEYNEEQLVRFFGVCTPDYNQPDHELIDRTEADLLAALIRLARSDVSPTTQVSRAVPNEWLEAFSNWHLPMQDANPLKVGDNTLHLAWRSHLIAASAQPLTPELVAAVEALGFTAVHLPETPGDLPPADLARLLGIK